ncbi:MAG: sigma-70 family RNA polymerase sigma factor [Candidatus Zixiibacteriota bacterium]|nr:MAG: sigma-70 family RNA polymerase sigma factor [candidate division Zixibacteria bacterium]
MEYKATSAAISGLIDLKTLQKGGKRADLSDPDVCVIEEIRNGNYEAFGKLVRRYENFAYTLIRGLVGNDESARDITQEVFLRAYRSIRRFEQRSSFKTWLYKISYNTALAHISREKKMAERERFAASDRIDDSYKNQSVRITLDRIIGELKPEYRAVIILYYYEDLKYEEIAEALDCPIGTVKIRLYRAKYQLKQLWSRYAIQL